MDAEHVHDHTGTCPHCGGELTQVVETAEGWAEFTYCARCDDDMETRIRKLEVDDEQAASDRTDSLQ